MKLEIPIIVGFDDLESLLDDLKKLQTYKCFEGAEEVLVDIEDVAKVLMDHVKAKESVKGDDLIRRADALSCFHDWIDAHGDVHTADEMPEYQRIEQLPDAQPEESMNCAFCKLSRCESDKECHWKVRWNDADANT